MDDQFCAAPVEFKFTGSGGTDLPAGEFLGYGAVFGNVDSHGDVIRPGAFKRTLEERGAAGRLLPMHAMHGFFGGDGLPIGVFKTLAEDDKGLRTHGKISGMTTEAGKLHYERLRDGAYGGMSIGYKPYENGTTKVDGKRHLTSIRLKEISLVDDPSNALAKVDEMKRARGLLPLTFGLPDQERAVAALAAAIKLHEACLGGDDVPTADERAALLDHLRAAQGHLAGVKTRDDVGVTARDFGFLENFRLS